MIHKHVNKQAPVVESQEAFINAPIEVVWSVLTEFEQWPQWNESVSKIELKGAVKEGSEFQWVAGGTKIKSRIEELNSPNRIVWSGTTMGIKAVHVWELHPGNGGTSVNTEESFDSLIVRLFKGRFRKMLLSALIQILTALKREAERRHGTKLV